MVRSDTTTVYSFHTFEEGLEVPIVSTFKATREAIGNVHRGVVLEGTREEVDSESLDGEGRFRRVATGWGALAA